MSLLNSAEVTVLGSVPNATLVIASTWSILSSRAAIKASTSEFKFSTTSAAFFALSTTVNLLP